MAEDYHNFSTPSSHRLPTLTGTQALRNAVEKSRPISTSLPELDDLLCTSDLPQGGIPRGSVTEIYGPPGVGKTTFALQLVANVICASEDPGNVVWIDASSVLVHRRLTQIVEGQCPSPNQESLTSLSKTLKSVDALLAERFQHLSIDNLPYLLALTLHCPPTFPDKDTRLIVIDDLSSLLQASFSQPNKSYGSTASNSTTSFRNDNVAKAAASRRSSIIGNVALGLHKLAASKNVAIVTISKTSSTQKHGRAILRPAINLQSWVNSIDNRIALYRDDWPDINFGSLEQEEVKRQKRQRRLPLRCAELERLSGKDVNSDIVQFVISKIGLRSVEDVYQRAHRPAIVATPSNPRLNINDEDDFEAAGDQAIDEDRELHIPEDAPPSSFDAQNERASKNSVKRKAVEIADSEDEEGKDVVDPTQPLLPQSHGGFLPSSQLHFDEAWYGDKSTGKNISRDNDVLEQNKGLREETDRDEMLFDEFEKDSNS